MTTLISLIGEQPIPNLLPIRALQPEKNLLVYTDRTKAIASRLRRLISGRDDLTSDLRVRPYAFEHTLEQLQNRLQDAEDVLFNLTGGTKMMALAAYALAVQQQADFVYLESEKHHAILYRYEYADGLPQRIQREVLPPLISAADYLNAHLPGFSETGYSTDDHGNLTDGGKFERAIHKALQSRFDEVLAGVRPEGVADQIEIDLVIRCGNQVGIAEIKLGGGDSGKRGLDQLKMAGGREYLGTYTTQFMIVARKQLSRKIETLAHERDVNVIYVPEYRNGQPLTRQSAEKLARVIRQKLCPPSR